MSDKPPRKLNPLDRDLRKAHPIKGFCDNHTVLTITLRQGFELFNTRPYHNYETWSDGWYIEDENGVRESAEDLDDVVRRYLAKLDAAAGRAGKETT